MQALQAAFNDLYADAIEVDIVDIWTSYAPWPLNKFVQAYQFMAKRPLLWKLFWEYGRFPLTRRLTTVSTSRTSERVETLSSMSIITRVFIVAWMPTMALEGKLCGAAWLTRCCRKSRPHHLGPTCITKVGVPCAPPVPICKMGQHRGGTEHDTPFERPS